MASEYRAHPADTAGVVVEPSLAALAETLAKNTHEVWATQRVAEGCRYGPCRDEERMEHPGLLPYDDLPDSEMEYDRSTALETLRLNLSLGYRICRDDCP